VIQKLPSQAGNVGASRSRSSSQRPIRSSNNDDYDYPTHDQAVQEMPHLNSFASAKKMKNETHNIPVLHDFSLPLSVPPKLPGIASINGFSASAIPEPLFDKFEQLKQLQQRLLKVTNNHQNQLYFLQQQQQQQQQQQKMPISAFLQQPMSPTSYQQSGAQALSLLALAAEQGSETSDGEVTDPEQDAVISAAAGRAGAPAY
jgi:hypothetical protein